MEKYYLKFYILSFFDLEEITTTAQMTHVFQGKRTPSMFYLIEKKGWHHGFERFKRLSEQQLNSIVQQLITAGLLKNKEKGFVLTQKGYKDCLKYFKEHYYPQKIRTFTHSRLRSSFWNRLQLFTQVFSELSYQNNTYTPIIKHPKHQENVRLLFFQFGNKQDELLTIWTKEQYQLFVALSDKESAVLIQQFSGHQLIGKTKEQIAELYGMNALEFSFYLEDIIEKMIVQLKKEKASYPLTYKVLHILEQENKYGLSASTFESYQLLINGHSIEDIARIRRIKENTVKEHILEIAFVFEHFPYQKFIPTSIYKKMTKTFTRQPNLLYREIKKDMVDLEFYHFRLIELERMRNNGDRNQTSS